MKAVILFITFLVSLMLFVLYFLDAITIEQYPIEFFMSGLMSLTSVLLLRIECKPNINH